MIESASLCSIELEDKSKIPCIASLTSNLDKVIIVPDK